MPIALTTLWTRASDRECRPIPYARIASGVFAIHLGLLFLPPIPPFYKGSVWSFLLAYGAVVLFLCDRRIWVSRLAAA